MVRMINALPNYGGGTITPVPESETPFQSLLGVGDTLAQKLLQMGQMRSTARQTANTQTMDLWSKLLAAGYSPDQLKGIMGGMTTTPRQPGNIIENLAGVGTEAPVTSDIGSKLAGLPKPQKNMTYGERGLPSKFEMLTPEGKTVTLDLSNLEPSEATGYANLIKSFGFKPKASAAAAKPAAKKTASLDTQMTWADKILRGGYDPLSGQTFSGIASADTPEALQGQAKLILTPELKATRPYAYAHIKRGIDTRMAELNQAAATQQPAPKVDENWFQKILDSVSGGNKKEQKKAQVQSQINKLAKTNAPNGAQAATISQQKTYLKTATNPRTRQKMGWDGTKWEPIQQ
jgi:hypothetical protein